MICPKCGFSQPDDIYCANCGVHLEKYSQVKRKKQYRRGILVAILCVGALFVGKYFTDLRKAQKGRMNPQSQTAARESHMDKQTPTHRETHPLRSESQSNVQRETPPVRRRPSTTEESVGSMLTAVEWFERGKLLDDDSDAEIKCYLMALALDPHFAPAYYRLGAIYIRKAEYERADQAFQKFLAFASNGDKELYDIHVYYTPEQVENLLEEKESGASKEELTVVKFKAVRDQVLVPVLLNNTLEAHMQLDTGAEVTIISEVLANELGLPGDRGEYITLKTLAQNVQVPVTMLDNIRFGNVNKRSFPVAISDFGFRESGLDGILGMDFFRDYDLVIDKTHRVVVIRPRRKGGTRGKEPP